MDPGPIGCALVGTSLEYKWHIVGDEAECPEGREETRLLLRVSRVWYFDTSTLPWWGTRARVILQTHRLEMNKGGDRVVRGE